MPWACIACTLRLQDVNRGDSDPCGFRGWDVPCAYCLQNKRFKCFFFVGGTAHSAARRHFKKLGVLLVDLIVKNLDQINNVSESIALAVQSLKRLNAFRVSLICDPVRSLVEVGVVNGPTAFMPLFDNNNNDGLILQTANRHDSSVCDSYGPRVLLCGACLSWM